MGKQLRDRRRSTRVKDINGVVIRDGDILVDVRLRKGKVQDDAVELDVVYGNFIDCPEDINVEIPFIGFGLRTIDGESIYLFDDSYKTMKVIGRWK